MFPTGSQPFEDRSKRLSEPDAETAKLCRKNGLRIASGSSEKPFPEPSPAPLKGALQRFGLPAGPVRRPLVEASHDTVEAVLRALEPFGIRA